MTSELKILQKVVNERYGTNDGALGIAITHLELTMGLWAQQSPI